MKTKKKLECSTLHPPAIQTGMRTCEQNYVHPGVLQERLFQRFLCGVVSILHLHPKKGTAADTGSYCMLRNFLSSSNHCFFSANKVSTSTGGIGRHYFVGIVSCPILCQCFFGPVPAGPPVFWAFTLPPGEKGSSALETLCVGLAVSSLRCSGCFNNYWGHLDKL